MGADAGAAGRRQPLGAAAACAAYAAAAALLVGGGAWALTFVVGGPAARRAVVVSAAAAFAVQVVAFARLRLAPPSKALVAWGAGTLLRMAALAVYGLVVVGSAALPPGPALLSFVGFLFVSMLVEPLVLNVSL